MHTNKPRGHAIDLGMSKKRKREPEGIVCDEPTTSRKPRRGRDAAKEIEKFLVIYFFFYNILQMHGYIQ